MKTFWEGDLNMENSDANGQSSYWLRVFYNSKVNGAPYAGENLPACSWTWPTETYLQRRLRWLRANAGKPEMASPSRLNVVHQEPPKARAARPPEPLPAEIIH